LNIQNLATNHLQYELVWLYVFSFSTTHVGMMILSYKENNAEVLIILFVWFSIKVNFFQVAFPEKELPVGFILSLEFLYMV